MNIRQAYERLKEHRDALRTLAHSMQVNPDVLTATSELALRAYLTGDIIEAYVDVELKNGEALTWWAEIFPKEDVWVMEVSLAVTDEDGQRTLKEYPVVEARSVDALASQFFHALMQAKVLDHCATRRAKMPAIESAVPQCLRVEGVPASRS
ncbi:MAG: hypothetical protein H0X01_01080, partial [Nitrospira sp.]|nr:hypothetical protein [Nitrospira sp.]